MTLWRPKPGPVLTRSRMTHVAWGLAAPIAGRLLWGYPGEAWLCIGLALGACAWEATSPMLGRLLGWQHIDPDCPVHGFPCDPETKAALRRIQVLLASLPSVEA